MNRCQIYRHNLQCFNLVIEVLFFSSRRGTRPASCHCSRFNLVIEVLFFSSVPLPACNSILAIMFQSRNRCSFLFKEDIPVYDESALEGWFQSRNRGSFLFKTTSRQRRPPHIQAFQSRNRGSFLFKLYSLYPCARIKEGCFNLVIEVLFFSRLLEPCCNLIVSWFQSRNRGSFLFKTDYRVWWVCVYSVSIS